MKDELLFAAAFAGVVGAVGAAAGLVLVVADGAVGEEPVLVFRAGFEGWGWGFHGWAAAPRGVW
jgi:hypothetical protein